MSEGEGWGREGGERGREGNRKYWWLLSDMRLGEDGGRWRLGGQRCNYHDGDAGKGERGERQTIHVVGPGGRVQPERGAFQVGNSPHRRFIARNLHPVHRPPNDGDCTRPCSLARRCNGGRGRPSARGGRESAADAATLEPKRGSSD